MTSPAIIRCTAEMTRTRISHTFCSVSDVNFLVTSCYPSANTKSQQFAHLPRKPGCAWLKKRTVTRSASYQTDDYAAFLKEYRGCEGTEGEFVDTAGNVVGHHDGYEKFTVGQRKGLGVAFGQPKFVLRVDAKSRQVVLGDRENLASSEVRIKDLNWLVEPLRQSLECSVKVRYQQPSRACLVEITGNNEAVIFPREPVMGVAPGQAAVLYDGDRVLGGGWIQSA